MDERYIRQVILPEVGEGGQARLRSARAVVVGAGGLGSAVLYYLAAAGVGRIDIIDSDIVEMSNLNRQFIHTEADIGRSKAVSAMEKITRLNSGICVTASDARVTAQNAGEFVRGCDVAVSCADNRATRLILGGECAENGIPLIDGGVSGFEGYVLAVLPGADTRLDRILPAAEDGGGSQQGVIGAAAGIVGSMMALQAIKVLLSASIGRPLYYIDLAGLRILPMEGEKDAK